MIEMLNPKINIYHSELLTDKNSIIKVFTGRGIGCYSHGVNISIETNGKTAATEGWISIELNKNEALYLANFLLAFVKEKEIDTDAED